MTAAGKFTPGPWIFYADLPSTEPNWHIVTTANKMRVLANVHIEPGNEMDEANARLISAAPDMLAALQKIIDMNVQYAIDRYGDASKAESMACVEVARAAIAKAVAS